MKTVILKTFEKDFKKLPKDIQLKTIEKLGYLETNRKHPSLRTKKIKGCEHIWEGSITMSYRLTYHIDKGVLYLRRIGTHAILNRP